MSDLLIASTGDLIFAAGLADFRLGFLSILGHLEGRDLMLSVLGERLVTTEPEQDWQVQCLLGLSPLAAVRVVRMGQSTCRPGLGSGMQSHHQDCQDPTIITISLLTLAGERFITNSLYLLRAWEFYTNLTTDRLFS